jgi:hypothetical protein
MKITHRIAISALSCISFAALAQEQQQQSPFQPAASVASQSVTATATVGSPLLLNLTGVTVTDQSGQPIGPIQHILLSPSGCVDLAVLSLGGQKLIPVPWQLVTGTGAARGETEIATRATLALNVDRAKLQQAPVVTINQLSQPQTIQQVYAYFGQQQRQEAGTGATGSQSQTDVNVGGSVGATNRAGIGVTNQTGILSPTGPTNARPGQPGFGTNRPGQPSITPTRPPFNRPPTNRPPATTPGQSTPGQPTPGTPGQQPGQPPGQPPGQQPQ